MAGGLVAFGRRYRREAAAVMRASQERVHEAAVGVTPRRTGLLRELLRGDPTDGGLGYTEGWTAEDFREAGKPPYFVPVVLGTRHRAGHDPLTPSLEADRPVLLRDLAAAGFRAARG